jgi:hypothetical protein
MSLQRLGTLCLSLTTYGLLVQRIEPETADAPAKAVSSKDERCIAVTSDYAMKGKDAAEDKPGTKAVVYQERGSFSGT